MKTMRVKGNEWTELSEEEINNATQNYLNAFSEDDSFLQFAIVGKRPIRNLLRVDGAKGLKIKIGLVTNEDTGKQQLFPIFVAVGRDGQELSAPEEIQEEDESDSMQIMDDPNPPLVRCPNSCQ
jgi:hypothetical protein